MPTACGPARGRSASPARAKDAELVRRLQGGEAPAFAELVGRFSDELFRFAYSLTRNAADAEDVVQKSFLGVFQGIASFEGHSSLKTWLLRIVANQASKCRRAARARVRQAVAIDEGDGTAGGVAVPGARSAGAAIDSRLDLAAMLAQLSPEHREILLLREVEQLSYEEMAEALGVPRGTVESRLFRARQDLRRRFAAYFG